MFKFVQVDIDVKAGTINQIINQSINSTKMIIVTNLLIINCLIYVSYFSACIKGSLGVRDSQKLPWDFQKSMPGSLGLPTFKDI